jgi:hypothetical protein
MRYLLIALLFASCTSKSTDIVILNNVTDSVQVYVTLQSTEDVRGLWGITDTSVAKCKGNFWAKKGVEYHLNRSTPIEGAIVTFEGDNQSCQAAITNGFPTGLNNFEFTVNVPNEALDISCVDGVNSYIQASMPSNWGATDIKNTFPLFANVNQLGVFPYQCTVCSAVNHPPSQCWGNAPQCSTTPCQLNRTNQIGGTVLVEYEGKAK